MLTKDESPLREGLEITFGEEVSTTTATNGCEEGGEGKGGEEGGRERAFLGELASLVIISLGCNPDLQLDGPLDFLLEDCPRLLVVEVLQLPEARATPVSRALPSKPSPQRSSEIKKAERPSFFLTTKSTRESFFFFHAACREWELLFVSLRSERARVSVKERRERKEKREGKSGSRVLSAKKKTLLFSLTVSLLIFLSFSSLLPPALLSDRYGSFDTKVSQARQRARARSEGQAEERVFFASFSLALAIPPSAKTWKGPSLFPRSVLSPRERLFFCLSFSAGELSTLSKRDLKQQTSAGSPGGEGSRNKKEKSEDLCSFFSPGDRWSRKREKKKTRSPCGCSSGLSLSLSLSFCFSAPQAHPFLPFGTKPIHPKEASRQWTKGKIRESEKFLLPLHSSFRSKEEEEEEKSSSHADPCEPLGHLQQQQQARLCRCLCA